jgi:hypothetical protein
MSKLKALFIGNCHNNGLIHFLSQSNQFKNTYDIKQYANWELIESKESIPINDIKNADLFIYQPLSDVHGCYSTNPNVENSIGSFVKNSCKKISYPYVYCSSLWPIIQAAKGENRWFGNKPIDDLIKKGHSFSEIIEMYDNDLIDWQYSSRFNETLNILKDKESITDLKISSYIEDNISKELLFLIPQHPTSKIFHKLSNDILNILGMDELITDCINSINDAKLLDTTYSRPDCMFPIHKSVTKNYNFSFSDNYELDSKQFYKDLIKHYININ